jgi:Zn-dependent protease with chaperone function
LNFNFNEKKFKSRRKTLILSLLFLFCLAGVIGSIDVVAWLILRAIYFTVPSYYIVNLSILLAIIIFTAIGLRYTSLLEGGVSIARQLGTDEITDNNTGYYYRRVRNIVEEIAIASGVPVPRIFIMHKVSSINAFAAGYSPADAVIAVTEGALLKLNRDELQAVIAHEFSHIQNSDMRININLIALAFGINFLAEIYAASIRMMEGGGTATFGQILFCLALIVSPISIIASCFSYLLKSGINREREFLADAAAVRYTRMASGMIGALKKVSGLGAEGNANKTPEAVSHMMFNNEFVIMNILSTHPTIIQRIKAIDPNFSDLELSNLKIKYQMYPPNGFEEDCSLGFCNKDEEQTSEQANSTYHPDSIIPSLHSRNSDDYLHAQGIINSIPENLLQAARNYYGAIPFLFALLYSVNPLLQAKQEDEIKSRYDEMMPLSVDSFFMKIVNLNPSLRLPLAAICFPALAKHPRAELEKFITTVQAMIHVDNEVSIYKYCLGQMLSSQVFDALTPGKSGLEGNLKLQDTVKEINTLLVVTAKLGNDDIVAAQSDYAVGLLQLFPEATQNFQSGESYAEALDPIWPVLDKLNTESKKSLIHAITLIMENNNKVTLAEAELFRTICSILHMPVPLLHGSIQA